MIEITLAAFPALLGFITLLLRKKTQRGLRYMFLLAGALFHIAGTGVLCLRGAQAPSAHFIALDALGLLFLSITSLLFFLVVLYSWGYFRDECEATGDEVSRFFVPCMLLFLSAMTLVTLTTHLGLLWVAIEATTLASAPLIYYHRHHQALEAAWKYLLICSVGIALALLGIFFIAASADGAGVKLFVPSLVAQAKNLDARWLRIGFLLVLIGFGTKMGLAPLHNWLPDAHSEAPSPVSALLSGALLNCAFLGILRFYQILAAAGLEPFVQKLCVLFGLVSLAVAALFIGGQNDYKRMLAYSSIEHMGILALSVGIGAHFAGLLHALNHSLAKALLFLIAGQIQLTYRTKAISAVHGLMRSVPFAGILWALGGLAIIGSPPFAPFASEFLIFKSGLTNGHFIAMALYLLFLGIIFVAVSKIVFGMAQGEPRQTMDKGISSARWSHWSLIVPSAFLAMLVLLFGLYIPPLLGNLLHAAADLLGGSS